MALRRPRSKARHGEGVASRRILIVGAGGLGVPAAMALRRVGSCAVTLLDPDPVELSNLARQVIYRAADLGSSKVEAAARWLADGAAEFAIEAHRCALDASNALRMIGTCDFVIDATDNPCAKFLINDTCIAARRPFVYAGVIGLTGQAMTVIPSTTACLRCLFEEPPDEGEIASCREAGIVGPVAGAIGEVAAAQALQWLRGERPALAGKILSYDGAGRRIRVTPIEPRRGCRCGARTESGSIHVD